jgi:hypothetical protein
LASSRKTSQRNWETVAIISTCRITSEWTKSAFHDFISQFGKQPKDTLIRSGGISDSSTFECFNVSYGGRNDLETEECHCLERNRVAPQLIRRNGLIGVEIDSSLHVSRVLCPLERRSVSIVVVLLTSVSSEISRARLICFSFCITGNSRPSLQIFLYDPWDKMIQQTLRL